MTLDIRSTTDFPLESHFAQLNRSCWTGLRTDWHKHSHGYATCNHGAPVAVLEIKNDITEQNRAEQVRQEN